MLCESCGREFPVCHYYNTGDAVERLLCDGCVQERQASPELPLKTKAEPARPRRRIWRILAVCTLIVLPLGALIAFTEPPPRVELTQASGDGISIRGTIPFQRNAVTGRLEMVPLYEMEGVDIYVGSNMSLYDVDYAAGSRLTSDDHGKLVKQTVTQSLWNDTRHWAHRLRHPGQK